MNRKHDLTSFFFLRAQVLNRTPHSAGGGLGRAAPPNWWSGSRFICTPAWTSDGRRIQCRSDCPSTSARNLRFSKLTSKIFLNAVALSKTLETTGQRPQTTWRFPRALRKPGHGSPVRTQGLWAQSVLLCATCACTRGWAHLYRTSGPTSSKNGPSDVVSPPSEAKLWRN